MKALTTVLAERAAAKQGPPVDGLKVTRDAAEAFLGEDLVDACSFSRPTSYSGNLAARQFGMVGKLALRKHRKMRAGGFPQHFVLAVSADEVIAVEQDYTVRGGRSGALGPEVGRWRRSDLAITSSAAGYLTNVTVAAGEETVECCVGASPLSDSFLGLLTDPARQTPAVGEQAEA